MESLLSCHLIERLSMLGSTGRQQVIDYLSRLQARNYASGTLEAIVTTIRRFIEDLSEHRLDGVKKNLGQTTARDLDHFVERARERGLAPGTINTSLSLLKGFFEYLIEEGQMPSQPVRRHRHWVSAPQTLPKPMAEPDLIQFFKVIDSVRDRLLFLLMLRCGLRVSETCSLRWEAIDVEMGTIRINNSKGQVDRVVYLAPDAEQALKRWQARSSGGCHLFPSRLKMKRLAPLSRFQVYKLMTQYLQQAGITKPYSPHCLRHTFATQLLNEGISLEVLKDLMGHHSIQMTLRYAQLYESTKRHQYTEAMQRIEQRQAQVGR